MATSLDVFKQFVQHVQAASYYGKWVHSNPGAAAKWAAFRDSIIACKPIAAPDMGANEFGQALVKAALMPTYMPDPAFVQQPTPPPPPSKCYWGARIDGQFYQTNYGAPNADDAPWSATTSGDGWDLFEQHAGKKLSAVQWGGSGFALPTSATFPAGVDLLAHNRGAFSMYDVSASTTELAQLAAGSGAALATVDDFANAIKAMGRPILIRPFWEMNGSWNTPWPWQTGAGTTAETYVKAFQTFSTRLRAIAPNATVFWCCNVWDGSTNTNVKDPTAWYPGNTYVDWIGFDGYCYGTYVSPATLFGRTLTIINALAGNTAQTVVRPVGIGETGVEAPTSAPGKAAWITDYLTDFLPAHPEIKYHSWFNEKGSPALPHFEVGDAATDFYGKTAQHAAADAFRAGIANSRYLSNVAGSFPSGAKIPIPA